MKNKLMAVMIAACFSSSVSAESSKDEFQQTCESKLMSSMATQLMYMKRNSPDQYQKAKSEVQQLFEQQCGCVTDNVDEFLTISGYQTHQEDFRALKWAWTSGKRRHLNMRQQDALGTSASCFM
jgi:sugar (pentulose or hexulose) kinase